MEEQHGSKETSVARTELDGGEERGRWGQGGDEDQIEALASRGEVLASTQSEKSQGRILSRDVS